VSCAGLAPVVGLAERSGLQRLVARHVRIKTPAGVNADRKIGSLVAGMVAGADCIDDMALLRHAGMSRLFTGVRAPSTLGTFCVRSPPAIGPRSHPAPGQGPADAPHPARPPHRALTRPRPAPRRDQRPRIVTDVEPAAKSGSDPGGRGIVQRHH
jgi:hypothetical protein